MLSRYLYFGNRYVVLYRLPGPAALGIGAAPYLM